MFDDNVNLKTTNGNITANTILNAGNDLKAATDGGDIIMQNNVTAQNDIVNTGISLPCFRIIIEY